MRVLVLGLNAILAAATACTTTRVGGWPSGTGPSAGSGPGARLGHATAYMEAAGAVVLFGGFFADGQPLGDTWSWDGQWRRISHSGPPPRRWPAMAYDSRRRRLILHGGRDGVGAQGRQLDDTWEWNGSEWRLLAASGPGGRDHHRIVYDPDRDRVVLFGGWDGQASRSDTWELVGESWQQVAVSGPAPRAAHGMAYDVARQSVVLFGGHRDTTFYADTWRWDGRAWTRIDATGPPGRSFHGMTYDVGRKRVTIAGGRHGLELFGDTWEFDGVRWTRAADEFPAQYVYELAYHGGRDELLFHGGGYMRDGRWTLSADTRTRRSAGWTTHRRDSSARRPEPRFGHRTAYDPDRKTIVLFGGQTPDKRSLGDLWEWNGSEWKLLASAGPAPRSWMGLSYDRTRRRLVLFGGRARDGAPLSDTWEWDGARWEERQTAGPRSRDHHAQAYDETTQRTIVHGGFTGSVVLGDAWEWDGVVWTTVDSSGPAPRAAHALAYSPLLRAVSLFGGLDLSGAAFGDTWTLRHPAWHLTAPVDSGRTHVAATFSGKNGCLVRFGGKDRQRTPSSELHCLTVSGWRLLTDTGPAPRIDAALAYDDAREVLVLFGGKLPDPDGRAFGDTWEWNGREWRIR